MIPYKRGIPVEAQKLYVQLDGNGFKVTSMARGKFIHLEGFLKPGPLFKQYRVVIKYDFKKRPVVTLPDENFSGDNRPIHTFHDGALCLYHHEGLGPWRPSMPLTLLFPMIAHWLWCYELWKASGKKHWHGDEYPHPNETTKDAS